jgi:hypothetical protein
VFCDDCDMLETMQQSSSCQMANSFYASWRECRRGIAASKSAKDILEMLVRSSCSLTHEAVHLIISWKSF